MSAIDTEQGTPEAIDVENESLPIGKIAAVAMISGVAFALAILWAVGIMNGVIADTERRTGPWVKGAEIGKPEIGIVDQQLFQVEKRALELTQQKLHKLDQYGWVSRKDQLIHIPITEAMKAIAAGKRPMTAPNPDQGGIQGQPGPVQPGGDPHGALTPANPAMGSGSGPATPAGPAVPGVQGQSLPQGPGAQPGPAPAQNLGSTPPGPGGAGAHPPTHP